MRVRATRSGQPCDRAHPRPYAALLLITARDVKGRSVCALAVGARIEVAHLAPTAVGSTVVCSARFVEAQGPLYWFEVWAEDERRRIGKGRIARAIVVEAELTARASA